MDKEETRKLHQEFARQAFELSQSFSSPEIEVIAMSLRFQQDESLRLANSDLWKVAAVLIVCFAYMCFHL